MNEHNARHFIPRSKKKRVKYETLACFRRLLALMCRVQLADVSWLYASITIPSRPDLPLSFVCTERSTLRPPREIPWKHNSKTPEKVDVKTIILEHAQTSSRGALRNAKNMYIYILSMNKRVSKKQS